MLGASCRRQDANDRCLSHGLGSDSRGTLESRSVEGPASLMAHQPSGYVGCISCSQECPSRSQGPPCACPLRQHVGGLLLKSPGGFAVTSTLQTGEPNPPVVPKEVVSLSSLHPRGPQYRSRHPPIFLQAEARGMEAPPRGGGADMEARVDLFMSREMSHCPLWFSLTHPAPPRPDANDADVAEALSVHISPDRSAPKSPGESLSGPGSTTSHCPALARAEYGFQI